MNIQRLRENVGLVYLVGVLGAFLIVGILIWAMIRYTQPAPLDTQRAAARSKALAELRGAETQALDNIGWVDQGKGIVRLRIEDAMKLVERQWQNPAAARSNLIARVEKAKALPPKPPEPPSQYE